MAQERFQYHLTDLPDGKQMLVRLHLGPDGKPISTSIGVALPATPTDQPVTMTFGQTVSIPSS